MCEEIDHSHVPMVGTCGERVPSLCVVFCGMDLGCLICDCVCGLLPLGLSGMTQAPVYQPMPSMMGMPAAMPMMPAAGGIASVPGINSVSVTVQGKSMEGWLS